MAIVGVLANAVSQVSAGAIVGNFATLTHTFGPSSIWGHPSLQSMAINDDDGSANVFVSQFIDSQGTHNVNVTGQFADKCTSITYRLNVGHSASRAICITEFFG
jgi:hypothetical protein